MSVKSVVAEDKLDAHGKSSIKKAPPPQFLELTARLNLEQGYPANIHDLQAHSRETYQPLMFL